MEAAAEGPTTILVRRHTSERYAGEYQDLEFFFKYRFKVEPCTKEGCQGPANCPCVHPGEQRRRDPRCYFYWGIPCQSFDLGGDCPDGDNCESAHGCLEEMLHPSRFPVTLLRPGFMTWPLGFLDMLLIRRKLEFINSFTSPGPYYGGARPAFEFMLNWDRELNDLLLLESIASDLYGAQAYYFRDRLAVRMPINWDDGDAGYKPYQNQKLNANAIYKKNYKKAGPCSSNYSVVPHSGTYRSSDPYTSSYKNVVPFHGNYKRSDLSTFMGMVLTSKHIKDQVHFSQRIKDQVDGVQAAFGHSSKTAGGGSSVCNLGGVARSGIRVIADTGATIHAVGDYRLLRGVKLFTTPRWVELPDGTELRIAGIGRIELDHFSIPNVYLIEGFQKILISMSQLDIEHGMHSCFGKGKCEIMLDDGTVVGAGFLEDDGMYVLRFLEVPELPAQE